MGLILLRSWIAGHCGEILKFYLDNRSPVANRGKSEPRLPPQEHVQGGYLDKGHRSAVSCQPDVHEKISEGQPQTMGLQIALQRYNMCCLSQQ